MQAAEIKHGLRPKTRVAKTIERDGRTTEEADRTARVELITKQKSDYARSVKRNILYGRAKYIRVELSIKGGK